MAKTTLSASNLSQPGTSIIPNSFQKPNFYSDILAHLLKAEEQVVLDFIIRHTWGWKDKRDSLETRLSVSFLEHGDGKHYFGCGLGHSAIEAALKVLCQCHIIDLLEVNRVNGNLYRLNSDIETLDLQPLADRKAAQEMKNSSRTAKARFTVGQGTVPCGTENEFPVGQGYTNTTVNTTSKQVDRSTDILSEHHKRVAQAMKEGQEAQANTPPPVAGFPPDTALLAAKFVELYGREPAGKSERAYWIKGFRALVSAGHDVDRMTRAFDSLTRDGLGIASPLSLMTTCDKLARQPKSDTVITPAEEW